MAAASSATPPPPPSASHSTLQDTVSPPDPAPSTISLTPTPSCTSQATPHVPIPRNGVDYRRKLVLAPMVRSGELPSRLLALHYGADLVWGPETVDRALVGSMVRQNPRTNTVDFCRVPSNGGRKDEALKENVICRLYPEKEGRKLVFQLGTADPELAVRAAEIVAPHCAGVDVNAGCPKPFSTSGGMGAALLTHEEGERLCSILRALVEKVGSKFEIGISVKIRLLKTEEETRKLVEKLCKTGITGLTIHCRTREMRKTEKAVRVQLKMVGDVCRAHGVACLMNGDVEDREQAVRLVKDFGVDGAMIATAAEKNPSVFRPAEEGGKAEWKEIIEGYMVRAIAVENRWGNTKFLLAQMMPGKEQQKCGLSPAKNYADMIERLELLDIGGLMEKAQALDDRLGLNERMTKAEQKAQKRAAAGEGGQNGQVSKRQKKREQQRQQQHQSQHRSQDHQEPGDYMTDLHHDIVGHASGVAV